MAKRRKTRSRRRRVKGPMDYVKIKMSMNDKLFTDASGQIQAFINARNLAVTYTPVSSTPGTHSGLENYAKWQDLFDSYRVQYIKLSYRPNMNVVGSTAPGSAQMPFVYVAFDKDNGGAVSTIDNINSMKGSRLYDLKKRWTFTTKVPKYSDDNNPKGWQNLQSTAGNLTGTIQIVGDTAIVPNPGIPIQIGTLKIEYIVELKNRSDTNSRAYFGVNNLGTTLTVYPTIDQSTDTYKSQQADGNTEYFEFNQ